MAVDIFLMISNDVHGESQDSVYGEPGMDATKVGVDVLAWSWGMTQSGTSHMGAGSGGGKVNVNDISITKLVDASSTEMMKKCCDGTHFDNAKLIVRKSAGEGGPINYFQINMEHVMITSYQTGGAKDGLDRIQESLTLNFRQFEVVYIAQEKNGDPKPAAFANYNIAETAPWEGGPGEELFG